MALICYVAQRDKSVKVGIPVMLERLGDTATKRWVEEELAWRLEFLG